MATVAETRVPTWFWVVAGLALCWSLVGVASYMAEVMMTEADVAALPEGQRTLYESRPAWVTGAYAVAVFGSSLGSIALLLRRTWAKPLFLASLIAVILQFGWAFGVGKAHEVVGPSAFGLPVAIIVIAVALYWFAGMAAKRGWLR